MRSFYPLVVFLAIAGLSAPAQQAVSPSKPANVPTTVTAPANPADEPLFNVPPMPKGKVSLVGGIVTKIDRVRNRLWVRPFGGNAMTMGFDERSHIYRDGVETTQLGIRKGDRVYIDTMLDGPRVFARNIRVETQSGPADARGQLVSFNPKNGNMTVRDELSSQFVTVQVNQNTAIKHNGQPATRDELQPGALIAIQFAPSRANRGTAQEISVIAIPGTSFLFAGTVTYLDLHLGTMAVQNRTNDKTYELHFTPGAANIANNISVGSDVTINAVFDGSQYNITNMAVNQARKE